MLVVQDLSKHYDTPTGRRLLFQDLSFDLAPAGRLAILGRNGQGKSTLIKILGGAISPTRGRVRWTMAPSWPLGFGGAFQGSLTGLDNIRFVSRIYDRTVEEVIERTEGFAELGDALAMPVKHYSSGMRARLAFGLSLAIDFDCYLIDEIIAVGDVRFREKCQHELFERRAHRAFIIASHDTEFMRATCERAIIVEDGKAKLFEDMDMALEVYAALGEHQRQREDARAQGKPASAA